MTEHWIERLLAKGIRLANWREGRHKAVCPAQLCSHRASRRERDVYVRVEWDRERKCTVARWHCYHCGFKGATEGQEWERHEHSIRGKLRIRKASNGQNSTRKKKSTPEGAPRVEKRSEGQRATLSVHELRGGGRSARADLARAVQLGDGRGRIGAIGGAAIQRQHHVESRPRLSATRDVEAWRARLRRF